MRFYSDKLNKIFETEEELKAAETAKDSEIKKEEESKALKVEEDKKAISIRKKELSDVVEAKAKEFNSAYDKYEAAKAKAKKELNEKYKTLNAQAKAAEDEYAKAISEAEKEVRKASEEKTNAIAKFNEEFGPYKTVLTGDKAIAEYNRMVRNFEDHFSSIWDSDSFWKNFFRF
jgi:hypothetical protein